MKQVILFMALAIALLSSCGTKDIEQEANEQLVLTMKEAVRDPDGGTLVNVHTTYKSDSLCILHFTLKAKNALGMDMSAPIEYIYVDCIDEGISLCNVDLIGVGIDVIRHTFQEPKVKAENRDIYLEIMMNAIAQDYGALVDPFGGIRDLSEGIIRTPLDPDTTYSDDPLRMLRAIRFATRLSEEGHPFTIVPESLESMRRNRDRLAILSKERIVEELDKILLTSRPSMGFRLMDETGLLELILPALSRLKGVETVDGKGHKENFSHTLQVVDNVASAEAAQGLEPNLWLRWAALLHDIGKPSSKRFVPGSGWTFHGHEVIGARMVPGIFQQLKMPLNEKMKYVQKLVGLHLRPIALVDEEVTDSAVRRLLFDAGDDIDDLMLLCNADITSKNPAKVSRIRANFELVKRKLVEVEEKDAIRNFKNPITGEYVMELFGIPPGKEIGILKEYVKEAILEGEIGNNFEEADALMRKRAAELGLVPVK